MTDAFHYNASLVMYSELNKQGMPLVGVIAVLASAIAEVADGDNHDE